MCKEGLASRSQGFIYDGGLIDHIYGRSTTPECKSIQILRLLGDEYFNRLKEEELEEKLLRDEERKKTETLLRTSPYNDAELFPEEMNSEEYLGFSSRILWRR